ncbi:MAG: SprT-like domain-containing protein [Bryobacteraceae bacterium]
MQVQSDLFFQTPEEIYVRVYSEIRPASSKPAIQVSFCRFANANSHIKMQGNSIEVRMSDLLAAAPVPVLEALAWILLCKLFRKETPRIYTNRYRLYLNRHEVRSNLHLVRQQRGRKFVSGPEGDHYNLEILFEELNLQYFHGLMSRPQLGWSRKASRTMLGHFDPSHNAIILSKILDSAAVGEVAVRYVLYHEMLHLRYPVEHNGARRCVHTPAFKAEERKFEQWKEARQLLKKL